MGSLRQIYDAVRERFERILTGRAPSDPLYLSNRTWQQKLKLGTLIGAPILIVTTLILLGATNVFRLHKVDPYEHPFAETSPSPVRTQPAPDAGGRPADLEVVNLRIARDTNPPEVTGSLRNNTNEKFASVKVNYYLSDRNGSVMGAETVEVRNVAPHGTVSFRAPIKVGHAEYVLIREIHAN